MYTTNGTITVGVVGKEESIAGRFEGLFSVGSINFCFIAVDIVVDIVVDILVVFAVVVDGVL